MMGNRIWIVLMAVFLLFTFLLVNPVPVMASESEIKVTCNGQEIISGDTTPSVIDNTDFGGVKVGEFLEKTFVICNTGDTDLNLIGNPKVSISGDTCLSISEQPASPITPGYDAYFKVKFTPGESGLRAALISITNDDPNESHYTFIIQGTGETPETPEISVAGNGIEVISGDATPSAADNTDFGTVKIGEYADKTFTIRNTGTAALNIAYPGVLVLENTSNFSVITQPDNIIAANGGNTTFTIRFNSIIEGIQTTTVSIASDDSDENPYKYRIQGTGINEPAVVSLAATEITSRSAVLRGTVKANYTNTTVTFEYGRNTDYGTTVTADQSPVTGGGIIWVTRTISGLTPSTTYHFRINGFNSTGKSNGSDRTFTTAWSYDDDDSDISYPTVLTDAADSLSSSSAVLNGRISSRGGKAVTNYGFYYSTDKNKWIKVKAGSDNLLGDFSYRLTGLKPETTYYYKAYAVNYRGTSYGVVRSFTTTWSYSDISYPTVLTDAADSLSSSSAVLNGRISSRGGKAITNFGFYYSTDKNNWIKVKAGSDNLLGDFSYRLTGLKPATTYYYKAYAVNYRGTSYGVVRSYTTAEKYEQAASKVIMRFYIGKNYFYINDRLKTMNTAPIISGNRTLLPVRYVAEALGANVGWDQNDQRVTIMFNNKTLILWIGHKAAVVNGEVVPIDPGNSNTTPIIVSGRCILPLRFVSEALGCQVDWNAYTQEIKVTYL